VPWAISLLFLWIIRRQKRCRKANRCDAGALDYAPPGCRQNAEKGVRMDERVPFLRPRTAKEFASNPVAGPQNWPPELSGPPLGISMKQLITLFGLLAVCGCVSSPRHQNIALPDGRQGYAVRCNGNHHGWGDCMNKAADLCDGGPYDVYGQNQSTGQLAVLTSNQSNLQGYSVPTRHREMIFACVTARR
jgi:hypothetical protein